MRAKVKERHEETIQGQRVTVQVLEPREPKVQSQFMNCRDDSNTPGQNFIRATKGRW